MNADVTPVNLSKAFPPNRYIPPLQDCVRLYYPYIVISFFVFIAHGMLLLNDGFYWDGWIIQSAIREQKWGILYASFEQMGAPWFAALHQFVGQFPNPIFAYKALAFLSITFTSILVFKIGQASGFLESIESLLIAVLSLIYPSFQVSVELIVLPYLISYCLFFLGFFLAVRAEKTLKGSSRWMKFGAITLFFVSFITNSLLVFYLAFLLFLGIFLKRLNNLTFRQTFAHLLIYRWYYTLLPILYWIVTRGLMRQSGLGAGYNNFILSFESFSANLLNFLRFAVYGQTNTALLRVLEFPFVGLGFLIGVQWLFTTFRREEIVIGPKSIGLLGAGILLLFLAIFPYAIVGKSPTLTGWDTRHALLVALPVSILTVAFVRFASNPNPPYLSRGVFTVLMIVVLGFTWSTLDSYIALQARWVKDRSILLNLEAFEKFKYVSVFWVQDDFTSPSQEYYRFYEWSSMFKSVWGGESRIGLDRRHYAPKFLSGSSAYFTEEFNLANFDPAGCVATIRISPGEKALGNLDMVIRYMYYRFLSPANDQRIFLRTITNLQIEPLVSNDAIHCQLQ